MRKIIIPFSLLVCLGGKAQIERIDTDRPDQTESVMTVPKKYFQAELGFGKENFEGKNYNLFHPGFLLKYGIFKRMELRLEGNFISEYRHLIPNTEYHTKLEPLEIGTKIALLEEKGLRPKTSFIVHLGLPFTASDADKNQKLFPSFRFTFQNSLSENIALGYNLGAEWDGYDGKPMWLYTFAPGFNIGKKWYAYIESFGFFKTGDDPQHFLDGGVAFYTSDNTKLDLSAGKGFGKAEPKNYVALGFSFRIPTGKTSTSSTH